MREVKFDIVARNLHFNEVVHSQFTLEQIWEGRDIDTWLKSVNANIIAKREWIGFKDKNGVEIYEGDIISWEGIVELVEWVANEDNHNMVAGFRLPYSVEEWEVIGNIIESPELLK